jgi:hypothetical protein
VLGEINRLTPDEQVPLYRELSQTGWVTRMRRGAAAPPALKHE